METSIPTIEKFYKLYTDINKDSAETDSQVPLADWVFYANQIHAMNEDMDMPYEIAEKIAKDMAAYAMLKDGLPILEQIKSEIVKHENDTDELYYNSQASDDANRKIHYLVDEFLFDVDGDAEYAEYCLGGTVIENYQFLLNKILLIAGNIALESLNAELISKMHTIIGEILVDDEFINRAPFEKLGKKLFKQLQKK